MEEKEKEGSMRIGGNEGLQRANKIKEHRKIMMRKGQQHKDNNILLIITRVSLNGCPKLQGKKE
jgi:hypothetical protein